MSLIIAPSIMACDRMRLADTVSMLDQSSAAWIHCDIMDGQYVPNITFGFDVLRALRRSTDKYLDVHLMTQDPGQFIDKRISVGADGLTIHPDSCDDPLAVLMQIRSADAQAGIAINPDQPIELIIPLLTAVDVVTVMGVIPGACGQSLWDNTLQRVQDLVAYRNSHHLSYQIQVDGGIKLHNAQEFVRAGTDVLVAGSAVFGSDDPLAAISNFQHITA